MRYCKKCVMPDTRPGIYFSKDGVCAPCINWDKRKDIDWDKRWKQLKSICDKYRGCNGDDYDCIIAVSGGKDSHTQVYIIKELMKMNPLLVTVNTWDTTETGRKNINNLSEEFGCNIIALDLNRKASRIMTKKALEKLGSPMWYYESAIYSFPYKLAMKLELNLLIYGENISYEYGGPTALNTFSALRQFENRAIIPINFNEWLGDGITMKDLDAVKLPTYDEMVKSKLNPIYLSYFIPWSSFHNYHIAKRHGFSGCHHEWVREGTIESYNQIDGIGYLINQWFKYPKYGHASATEMASRWIRAGVITRDESIKLVKKYDKHLDQKVLDSYLEWAGMTASEFWNVADKWFNKDLFEQDRFGVWKEKFTLE